MIPFQTSAATFAAILTRVAFVLSILCFQSCTANAPRSAGDFAAMDQAQFGAWMTDVRAWGEMQGALIVELKLADEAAIGKVADDLKLFKAAPMPSDLLAVLNRVGVDGDVAVGIVIAGNLLVNARGGWPTGERLEVMLGSLAAGLRAGASIATHGPLQP